MTNYLIPFFNAFVLFILIEPNQLLSNQYEWFKCNILPRLPLTHKVLGGCILCTSTWVGIIEYGIILRDFNFFLMIGYNGVVTTILYKLLKYEIH